MKKRLDVLVFEAGLAPSREMARRYIMAGEVLVNGQLMDKVGSLVDEQASLEVKGAARFVSRGGEKLQQAFDSFALNVTGAICADVGASTGGFSDCLLQHGAAKVYAIDVGYGQLANKLRQDERIIPMERTNARYVETLPDPIDFVCIDASFISLKLLLPVVKGWLPPQGQVVALIKPQFEAGKRDVGKNGVVKDIEVHRRVLDDVLQAAHAFGYQVGGVTLSPLKGPKGNIEFLAWLGVSLPACDLPQAIDTSLALAHPSGSKTSSDTLE
jgi:23S rRNA (cytidine1920-2'-O)/16S rRNA (cytidine1409-2'-O)-methyltransferase